MTVTKSNLKSQSGLFLIELIIVIVFFALSSAVCVQLFVKAGKLSEKSGELNMAMIEAQNAAESFKAVGGNPDAFSKLTNIGEPVEGDMRNAYVYAQYFDSDWGRIESGIGASFELIIAIYGEGNLSSAEIRVSRLKNPGGIIYKLAAKTLAGAEVPS